MHLPNGQLFRRLSIAAGIVATLTVGGYSITRTTSASSPHTSTIPAAAKAKNAAEQAAAKDTFMSNIAAIISHYSSVQTGVSVIDLDNDARVDAGETAAFTAASTTKVLTAAAYMHEVDENRAALDTVIAGSTAQLLLQRMLNASDNDAWYALNEYLGKATLQTYAESLGLTSYKNNTNVITAHDEASLLAKLYRNQITTHDNTQLLLSFMQNTNNEDLIPAALPNGSTIYHKYGELDDELHDAAIIAYRGHHFVLAIYTKNSDDAPDNYSTRVQLFHAITDAALQYITAA